MRFREKQTEIDAYQLSAPLKTETGDLIAETGDWIALVNGQQTIYKADVFAERYEPTLTDNPLLASRNGIHSRPVSHLTGPTVLTESGRKNE